MTRIALIAFLLALGLIAHAQEQDLTTVEPANSEELLAPYMKQLKMGCKMHYSGGRQELELRKKLKALGYLTEMNRAPTRIKVTSHVILPATMPS